MLPSGNTVPLWNRLSKWTRWRAWTYFSKLYINSLLNQAIRASSKQGSETDIFSVWSFVFNLNASFLFPGVTFLTDRMLQTFVVLLPNVVVLLQCDSNSKITENDIFRPFFWMREDGAQPCEGGCKKKVIRPLVLESKSSCHFLMLWLWISINIF